MHPQALHPAPGLLASPQLPVQMQAAGKVRLVTKNLIPPGKDCYLLLQLSLPPCTSLSERSYLPTDKNFITSQALLLPANLALDSPSSNTARTHDSTTSNHQITPTYPPSLEVGVLPMCPKPIKMYPLPPRLFVCFPPQAT